MISHQFFLAFNRLPISDSTPAVRFEMFMSRPGRRLTPPSTLILSCNTFHLTAHPRHGTLANFQNSEN